jgi:hypothetical protein
MELADGKNPFEGYLERLQKEKKKVNPIHEIVNFYYLLNGWEKMPKDFYRGKMGYGKLAKEAKDLYGVLKEDLDDCMWAIQKMDYLAKKGKFSWSISTCLKHKKL